MRKLLSLFLALAVVFSTMATFGAEEKAFDGYVYMTVERNTLGQGFVQEPIKVGYYQGESLAEITERMLGDRSTFSGDVSGYYLEGIKDGGEPENWSKDDIPSDIKNALGEDVEGRTEDDVLQAFDYTSYSGWMFTVDNKGIDVGAGGVGYADESDTTHYTDGSVVRLQYSIYGYGEDVGISWGYFSFDTTNKFVDRSELIRYIADINYDNSQSDYGTAYTDAVKLLNTWNVTEEQINNAIKALDETKPSTPDSYDGYVYMTVERNTLGQGFVQEPVKVGYNKGDSLAVITERMLGDRSTYEGKVDSNYYLQGIKDGGEPENWSKDNIPSDIKNALGSDIKGRAESDKLKSNDYSTYGGWMCTLDNKGTDVGSGDVSYAEKSDTTHYTDGSVIRLQYSLYGYGEDIGISYGYFKFDTTNKFADRSDLIRYIADINGNNEQEKYGKAYTEAVKLLNTWNVTEEQIDSAIDALDNVDLTPDEDTRNVEWAGAMNNFKDGNHITGSEVTRNAEEKWSYELNRTQGSWGAYYAGQTVIVDDYLYATGGGNLHKVDTKTGKGETVAVAGSSAFYYDYVAYGDGMIFVSTSSTIEAFDIDTLQSLGKVTGTFNQYHPMQYNKGYLICNGNIYKVNKNSENVLTQVGDGTIGGDAFNWSQGVFVNDYYYVVATNDIYCVDYKTNTVKYQYKYDENRTTTYNIGGELCYDSTTEYLYWGSYKQKNIHTVKLDENGDFDKETYKSSDISQQSVCAPVVYNNRIYVAGQNGVIDVINGNPEDSDFLKTIYTTNKAGMKIQSNPILSTGYEETTGNVYIYVQSYNAPGNIYYLEDNSSKTSGELQQLTNVQSTNKNAYAYEQIAVDDEGSIYFYNEEGYLYCYGEKHSHTYTYTSNGNGTHKKSCDGCDESEEETCTFENDKCVYCGVERSKHIYGDINLDGEVNVIDSTLLQKYITKMVELNDEQKANAMFGDMKDITVRTVSKIQKYLAFPQVQTEIGSSFYTYSK